MRARLAFVIVAALAVYCAKARGDEEPEQVPVRVLCEGGRVAAIQFAVPAPGVVTLQIPADACEQAPEPAEKAETRAA